MAVDLQSTPDGPLSGIRVLDLTGGAEQYCAKLMAQLGADVVLVEPIEGSASRREGPFIDDKAHSEHSLQFAYLNQGKRGLGLDLKSSHGRDIFKQLVSDTDLIIESERPGHMRLLGLDRESLSEINSGLIMVSITPFGQTGPLSEYEGGDLVSLAMGGLLSLGGYPGLAPTAPYGNQAVLASAQFAAVASLIALWELESQSGERVGQHIDVSVQESVAMALENAVQYVELENTVRKRTGGEQSQAGTGLFPCKDGEIYLMAAGIGAGKFWQTTTQWLLDGGAPAEQFAEERWHDAKFLASDEAKKIFADIFIPFAADKTKTELYIDGQRRRIPICPLSTTADLLENEQLGFRGFFASTPHSYTGRTLMMPGAPYQLSASPWQVGRPSPRLGEHTAEILCSLGLQADLQNVLLREGVVV